MFFKYSSLELNISIVNNQIKDIRSAVGKKSGVFIALIDLSDAFDTVDHDILLTFLKDIICIKGLPLNWFTPYITGCMQCIPIENVMLQLSHLMFQTGFCYGTTNILYLYTFNWYNQLRSHIGVMFD